MNEPFFEGSEEYISSARANIDRLLRIGSDEVVGLYGISIVERGELRPPTEDCHQYTLGMPGTLLVYGILMAAHREVDVLKERRQPGDIIIYSDNKAILHVGKVHQNGRDVVSKWGGRHVYSHPPLMLPTYYGDNMNIWRPHASFSLRSDGWIQLENRP